MKEPRTRTRTGRQHPFDHEPEAVRHARRLAGLSQKQLGEAIGVSQRLISDIENGWRNATPPRLRKIAEALNVPVVWLERKRNIDASPGEAA